MSTALSAPPAVVPTGLSRIYLTRAAFAFAWAVLIAATSTSDTLSAPVFALALLYPAVDLAAVLVDARSATAAGRPTSVLLLNAVISLAAVVGIALAGTDDVGDVVLVWGAWAIASGGVQLVVAVLRRSLGGQWPLILSGGISVLAGVGFLASAADSTSLRPLAGYATLGGLFFLVSGLRLRRTTHHTETTEVR
ncbi:hypothetical protein L2K70_03540 [Nocardioides KLBMP 9356]|uniref:DUF308 domain-containing protein n=1 Tax=Nocardioides potassii TaxID=2911371 RepID=A0ABS9H8W3_9ACTN|nr:hypothetical protein [Nocardioides potassii]MCF6376666.1 hypothetical protein [Nocardioides potassii]